jgi:glycosyltransferase involved in cell wall biosynthesis
MNGRNLNATPLVSVIIPTFNRAHLLDQTLQSVINQSYQNWEAIVVDDGSEDETSMVVAQRQRNETRISYVIRNRGPKGASSCRNLGLEHARGDYVVFLDSDDVLAAHCLEHRCDAIVRMPDVDFVVFPTKFFAECAGDLDRYWNQDSSEADLARFLRADSVWSIMGPIWQSSSVRQLNGFDEELTCWQDVDLHLRAICKPLRYVKLLDRPADCYARRHSSGITQTGSTNRRKLESVLRVFQKSYTSLGLGPSAELRPSFRIMLADLFQMALDSRNFDIAKHVRALGQKTDFYGMRDGMIWFGALCLYRLHQLGLRGAARLGKRLIKPFCSRSRGEFLPLASRLL